MNKSNLRNFAIAARNDLIERVEQKAYELGITETKVKKAQIEASDAIYINGKALDSVQIKQRDSLIAEIDKKGYPQVIEEVAYTWFNRFCALRFMEINNYLPTGVRALSSTVPGSVEPDIMREAFNLDFNFQSEKEREAYREKVFELKEKEDQNGLFKYLLIKQCNSLNTILPFLFEKIGDCTEILFPDNLLNENSFLRDMTNPETIYEKNWQDVEIIGWLYQYYISEKKDQVFAGLKKNIKISQEDIPAATQLFTPHWIVRYLVENSLGRLWMMNHPESSLVEQMDFYISPEQPNPHGDIPGTGVSPFLKITSPEELKICDPACGSGHMLVYAFDLLYAIYEETGYVPSEIPEKILNHNLYGIEIDKRAGELAAFALVMKARKKHRRFFRKGIQPHICVLENIHFDEDELRNYKEEIGHDLFTANLFPTLRLFEAADNFGSLIRPAITDVSDILHLLEEKDLSGNLFFNVTHKKVLKALQQVDYLNPKYHVVIANPPYMGSKGMNGRLKVFAEKNYPDSKSDLFAMFMERNLDLAVKHGTVSMITMQSWMFLSSFEKLRKNILNKNTIVSMAHLGARAFDSIGGEVVSTTAFVINNEHNPEYRGAYLRLVDGKNEAEKEEELRSTRDSPYRVSAADFKKIPGSPIAYWVSDAVLNCFSAGTPLANLAFSDGVVKTGKNDLFLRFVWECSGTDISNPDRYLFCAKGGDNRNYYGNMNIVVKWDPLTREHYRRDAVARITPEYLWCKKGITWTKLSTTNSFRLLPERMLAETVGPAIYPESENDLFWILAILISKVSKYIFAIINPTVSLQTNDVLRVPIVSFPRRFINDNVQQQMIITHTDWDSYETSWEFTESPLLKPEYRKPTLQETYQRLRAHWQEMTLEMQRLEEENNRIFIDAYGLQDELTPEVPLSEITLTCNPYYRYGADKSEEELEERLLLDTIKEYISYAVGCMLGRYSLDQEGLAFAGGEFDPSLYKTFPVDRDNVIPILAEDYFTDDIVTRFVNFVRITFSEVTLEENLDFIADALGRKNKETARDTIRRYFLNDFYKDHVKTYKKRPIYWLFSSGKEKAFNALVYLHRYQPDTIATLRTDYLHRLQDALEVEKQQLQRIITDEAGNSSARKAAKKLAKLDKQILELKKYEEVVHHYADMRISLDLDDGVKVNYAKLKELLAKI
ncbi:MAG: BREX-1 system adenine-specific DNA-methyltransferase PglX [Eubacteriales bacterium]|nr:BREX-1 system adenine-specific DNA-methyltransferase PglX [Eubacteriales bacterium]